MKTFINTTYVIYALLIMILVIAITLPYIEHFSTKEILVTSQQLNFYKYIRDYAIKAVPPSGWDYILYRLSIDQKLEIYGDPHRIILDPIDYIENASQYDSVEMPAGYFFVLTSYAKKDDFKCAFDFNGKKIGFFDISEKKLIDTITYGYRIKSKPVYLPFEFMDNLSAVWDKVDAIVLYIVPKSKLAQIIESQELFILNISSVSIHRLKFTHPYLELDTINKKEMFNQNTRVVSEYSTISVLKMTMVLVTLKPFTNSVEEGFITRLNLSPAFKDPNYVCVGDENATSNQECISEYDKFGRPKPKAIVDKRCEKDTDCPFYQANKNYPNVRGSCLSDGTCEMPLGVRRIGYTKYFDKGQYAPFCYQCKNVKDINCCETQYATPLLKSPDYAFENDTTERKNYNLPIYTKLSMM